MEIVTSLTGFIVGLLVGFTGMGGGAVMTPVLILFLGVAPSVAVGTDLFYALVTKSASAVAHGMQKTVCWKTAAALLAGSAPGAFLASLLFRHLHGSLGESLEPLVMKGLGTILMATAIAPFIAGRLRREPALPVCRPKNPALLAGLGFVVGAMVTFTSVGSGVLIAATLFTMYPAMPAARVVGTDVAHAVALLAVAAAAHGAMGNVDYPLAGRLLLGSVPGALIGSALAARAPEKHLRMAASAIMLAAGAKLV